MQVPNFSNYEGEVQHTIFLMQLSANRHRAFCYCGYKSKIKGLKGNVEQDARRHKEAKEKEGK